MIQKFEMTHTHDTSTNQKLLSSRLLKAPVLFHDNGLLFLKSSLVIQICDLGHDSRPERHSIFFKMFSNTYGVLKIYQLDQ